MAEQLLNRFGNRRGMSSGSRANLSKPGKSNSPNARPPISLTALLRTELARVPLALPDGKVNREGLTNAHLVIKRVLDDALDGNTTMLRELLDRVEGKPNQTLSGPGGIPIEINQSVKVFGSEEIRPALESLIACGAVQICTN